MKFNKKLLYDHLFVHNYFRCKEQISKLQSYKKQGNKWFCSLCFEPNCNHKVEKEKYRTAVEQLGMWADVALMYGQDRFIDLDEAIPHFPTLGFDSNITYVTKPMLDLPISIVYVKINNGDKMGFTDGKANEKLTDYAIQKRFGSGIWYGYFDEEFHLLTLFENGKFTDCKRFKLPNEKVWGLEDVKFDMGIGTWYLPQVEYYHEFHRYLQCKQ